LRALDRSRDIPPIGGRPSGLSADTSVKERTGRARCRSLKRVMLAKLPTLVCDGPVSPTGPLVSSGLRALWFRPPGPFRIGLLGRTLDRPWHTCRLRTWTCSRGSARTRRTSVRAAANMPAWPCRTPPPPSASAAERWRSTESGSILASGSQADSAPVDVGKRQNLRSRFDRARRRGTDRPGSHHRLVSAPLECHHLWPLSPPMLS